MNKKLVLIFALILVIFISFCLFVVSIIFLLNLKIIVSPINVIVTQTIGHNNRF